MKNDLDDKGPNKNEIDLINPYQKKALYFKKRIISSTILSFALLATIIIFAFYEIQVKKDFDLEMSNLENQINKFSADSTNIQTKIHDATKFKQLWAEASEAKKNFSGIDINDVNNKFYSLVDKYQITDPTMNISIPEVLQGKVYSLQVLDLNLVNCNISFQSLTDKIAIDFINDFINSLHGYVIINNFMLTKAKKDGYSDQDLVRISNGDDFGLISVKISFSWYFLQSKPTK